jgi:hypothetical protein
MKEYGYSYKADTSDELIGHIQADSYAHAQQKLTIIKQLNIDSIERLFKITEITSNGEQDRKY